ncbi:MAG: hypothetical protein F6K17_16890, partial [Okeania sp. SIO3C4]|nr:hypothetical protein [Okeania sp. SIO3C4]
MISNTNSPACITHAFATPIAYQIHEDVNDLNERLAVSIQHQAANNVSDDERRA